MKDNFLELHGITKRYDQHVAVRDVSLGVPRGKIYGLLGPNGAGKTSTIRMITGITVPDEGQILFDGAPLTPNHARHVGYMPEERGLYKKMKVHEQVQYLLTLKGMSPTDANHVTREWLIELGLRDWAKRPLADLSKGMQQKVQFISTVAHRPKLLILDEPFSGLDPVNAKVIEERILKMKAEGTTIIFSTHRMEQVEELCDYIALFNRGEVILEEEIGAIREQFQKNSYRIDFVGDASYIRNANMWQILELEEDTAHVQLPEGQGMREIIRYLMDTPLEVRKVELFLPRLNDIFIELVGKDAPTPVANR
ncbi:MAG: ATP-binding cassette domain-containing protein [Bacteroidota bacterium]